MIWIYGNHDEEYRPPAGSRVEVVCAWSLGQRLHVQHSYTADTFIPGHKLFFAIFRHVHWLHTHLGAESMHVARYAKRWRPLYGMLCAKVQRNAVRYGRERGFAAVACGHTHLAADVTVDGVRYINTGAWTEEPLHYLAADETALRLVRF